jgi:hypothetical protein
MKWTEREIKENKTMKTPQMTQSGLNYVSHDRDADMVSQVYEQTFTDMAYGAFESKYPELAPMVTTFQVIISDIDEGSAVGAFIMDVAGQVYHVPVVMMDNKLKPLDMIYSKEMDKFFPFTEEWLEIIESSSLMEEGEAVGHKDLGLQNTHDVTRLLQPPTTAYRGGLGLSPTGMSKMPGMNTVASEGEHKEVVSFPELLKVASEATKQEFLKLLEENPKLLKFAAENFDLDKMQEAFQKTAAEGEKGQAENEVENDTLRVLDIDCPTEEIKEVFQGSAVKAMEEMAARGFTARDSRKNLNVVYDIESPIHMEQVEKSGFYKMFKQDGSCEPALIITHMIPRNGPHTDYDYYDFSYDCGAVPDARNKKFQNREKLVIFQDGRHFKTTNKIVAMPCTLTPEQQTGFDGLMSASMPKKKDAVIFIKKHKDTFVGSCPMYIEKVIMEPSGATRYTELDPYIDDEYKSEKRYHSNEIGEETNYMNNNQITILPSLPTAAKPFYSDNRTTLYLSKEFLPVVLGDMCDIHEYLLGPSSVTNFLRDKAYQAKACDLKIANRGMGEFSINGRVAGNVKEATEKVAREYKVNFEVAYEKIASLKNRGDSAKLLVVPFEKDASIFTGTPGTQVSPEMVQQQAQEQAAMQEQAMMEQQAMQQQAMMDPMMAQQMPMDPMAMQQMPMDPALMQAGEGMMNPEIFNLGAIGTIVKDPKVLEMMNEYTPALERAMDNAARLLLTLYTEGGQHMEDLGEERFKELEGSARNTFKEIGKLLLLVTRHPKEL